MLANRCVSAAQVDGLYVERVIPRGRPELAVLFVHGGPGSNSSLFGAALTEMRPYVEAPIVWTLYDQRACGRSSRAPDDTKMTHAANLDDFGKILAFARAGHPEIPLVVMGHSYGARLAFDYFQQTPPSNVSLVMLGRGRGFWDSLNMSTYLDVAILRHHDPEAYEKAYEILQNSSAPPYVSHAAIVALFKNPALRSQERLSAYWGNLDAMHWAIATRKRLGLHDDDSIYRSVTDSLPTGENVASGFDPAILPIRAISVIGFFDLLMAGPVDQGLTGGKTIRFMGSGHYPHFEEPERLVSLLLGLH